jgi:hypothetical protein
MLKVPYEPTLNPCGFPVTSWLLEPVLMHPLVRVHSTTGAKALSSSKRKPFFSTSGWGSAWPRREVVDAVVSTERARAGKDVSFSRCLTRPKAKRLGVGKNFSNFGVGHGPPSSPCASANGKAPSLLPSLISFWVIFFLRVKRLYIKQQELHNCLGLELETNPQALTQSTRQYDLLLSRDSQGSD